jgi:hypothetical protein
MSWFASFSEFEHVQLSGAYASPADLSRSFLNGFKNNGLGVLMLGVLLCDVLKRPEVQFLRRN